MIVLLEVDKFDLANIMESLLMEAKVRRRIQEEVAKTTTPEVIMINNIARKFKSLTVKEWKERDKLGLICDDDRRSNYIFSRKQVASAIQSPSLIHTKHVG